MTHPKKLVSTASILAVTLTMSACGSSNKNSDAAPQVDPFNAAEELKALSGEVETEGSALFAATEAMKAITPLGSNGNSRAAMMSAQDVLAAKENLEDKKSAAEAVLADWPDTAENAAERELLKDAIEAAEAVLDGDEFEAALQAVTGTNAKKPMTPEDRGQEVAEAVLDAFGNVNMRLGREALATNSDVTRMTSSGGQPFEEIFKDVTDRALGADGALIPTISVAGENVKYGVTDNPGESKYRQGEKIEGSWVGSSDIKGFFQCMGAGCEFKADKLVGPWVFAPSNPALHYIAAENGQGYTEVRFVEYGHWLAEGADDSVNIYADAHLAGTNDTIARPVNWETIEGEDASATYSGDAAGRSVRQEFSPNGKVDATHSGSFTADVSLTATFGDSPMLEGSVSGFNSVDNPQAVDPDWEVTLEEAVVMMSSMAGAEVSGTANEDGTWRAQSYLDEGISRSRRPDGIYGTFDAGFTNGNAAGAFATRKDD